MDFTDIYRAFYPKAAKNTFFSSAHGTFSRVDHMLGHKTSLSKFKTIEIISRIFFQSQQYETRNKLKKNGKAQTRGYETT